LEEQCLLKPKERELFFTQQVDQDSIAEITKGIITINNHDRYLEQLYGLHSLKYNPKPIEIYIDSYGGNIYQCFGLISVIEKSITPVHTIVTGCAMSCGFMILISGHKRFGYRLSTPLYHQVTSGFWGKLEDMEIDVKETRRLQTIIEQETLEKTNITKKKLTEIRKTKTDWFMNAEEAKELGVIDEII
jgi:ATP-dependent Clp protease protease subunit